MANQNVATHLTARLDPETAERLSATAKEVRQSKTQLVVTLLNGWAQLTGEQRLAAIRGGVVHDPDATYHNPNTVQEETDPVGDSTLSPARA